MNHSPTRRDVLKGTTGIMSALLAGNPASFAASIRSIATGRRHPGPSAQALQRGRTLHFPHDELVGYLAITPMGSEESCDDFFEAVGDVFVPEGATCRFSMFTEHVPHLPKLRALQPDDLQTLWIWAGEGQRVDLSAIRHLSGLRELDLDNVQLLNSPTFEWLGPTNLRTLGISYSVFPLEGLDSLLRLPHLEKVEFFNCALIDSDAAGDRVTWIPLDEVSWGDGTQGMLRLTREAQNPYRWSLSFVADTGGEAISPVTKGSVVVSPRRPRTVILIDEIIYGGEYSRKIKAFP